MQLNCHFSTHINDKPATFTADEVGYRSISFDGKTYSDYPGALAIEDIDMKVLGALLSEAENHGYKGRILCE